MRRQVKDDGKANVVDYREQLWKALALARGRAKQAAGDLAASSVNKQYEGKSIIDLAGAPVDALQGVSASDAEHLKAAFGVVTVQDLGTNKYFLWAQAITKLAE